MPLIIESSPGGNILSLNVYMISDLELVWLVVMSSTVFKKNKSEFRSILSNADHHLFPVVLSCCRRKVILMNGLDPSSLPSKLRSVREKKKSMIKFTVNGNGNYSELG